MSTPTKYSKLHRDHEKKLHIFLKNPKSYKLKKNMVLMFGTQCNEFDNLIVKFEMTTLIRKKL